MKNNKESKYKSQINYISENTVKIGINIDPKIKEDFRKCCEANGSKYSTILRKFILDYIEKNKKV